MSASKIYVVPDSGLSNRLQAVISGILLARESNRQAVIVWHRDAGCNARLDEILQTDYLPAQIIEPNALAYELFYDQPRKKNLYLSRLFAPLKFKRTFYGSGNLLNYCEDAEALLNVTKETEGDMMFFAGYNFFDFPQSFFQEVIRPSKMVYERAEQILGGRPQPKYCIQIRRTDHRKSIEESPVALFYDKAQSIGSEPFFLATDDDSLKSSFSAQFPDRAIFNPDPATRATEAGIVDAMAEIVIMSRCDTIYGSSGSTFPQLASWLGGNRLYCLKK